MTRVQGLTEITADDILDSRDIIARIEWLESDDDKTEDETDELAALQALVEQASGTPDWTFGESLIRSDYFVEYAQQLADDIGAINADANWPVCHIDWEAAAESLKQDYYPVDFNGIEYQIRA